MNLLVHILVVVIVLCVLFALARYVPVPPPFGWLLYLVLFIIALAVLLPFLGIHLGLALPLLGFLRAA